MTTTTRRAGDIHTWDSQACIWGTQYKLIERVPGKAGRWIIEQLPPSPAAVDRVVDFYAAHEAVCTPDCHTCMCHTPIRDKTWAECDENDPEDYPRIIGWTTVIDEMYGELDRLHQRAGYRSEIQFVSAAKYAEAF